MEFLCQAIQVDSTSYVHTYQVIKDEFLLCSSMMKILIGTSMIKCVITSMQDL